MPKKAPLALFFLVSLALPGMSQITVISDFELQTPGANVPSGGVDVEGWRSVAGTQRYMPDGVNQVGPCQLPLNGSNGYCEITPNGLGPATPVVAPSSPGAWPFTGGVSRMIKSVTVPINASSQVDIAVDWYWATAEGANGSGIGSDDFAEIVLVNPVNNTVVATLLYVDTYAPNVIAAGNTCFSGVSGVFPLSNVGNARSATVSVPAAFHGSLLDIHVIAGNQLDNLFDSVLWIDNLRWVDPAGAFALTAVTSGGGAGDLTLSINGTPTVGATDVQLLVSGTAAPLGLGTGIFLGLVPDALLINFLYLPSQPFYPFHYPIGFSPFAVPFALTPGTLSALSGQTWDAVAFSYSPALGILDISNYQRMVF